MHSSEAYEELILQNKKLELELKRLKAQSHGAIWQANKDIDSLMKKDFKASAVIINVTSLDGKKLIDNVAIHDGLSQETLRNLKIDIEYTLNKTIAFLKM